MALKLQPLPVVPYSPRTKSYTLRRTYPFSTNGEPGFRLADAARGSFESLDDSQHIVLPPEYDKIRYSLNIIGLKRFVYQKNVQRMVGGIKQPSRRAAVLRHIVQFWETVLHETAAMKSCGNRILLGPGGIELKHLYIDTLYQYGKTFEPCLKYDAAMVAQDAITHTVVQVPRLLLPEKLDPRISWMGNDDESPFKRSSVAALESTAPGPAESQLADILVNVLERLSRLEDMVGLLAPVITPGPSAQQSVTCFGAQPTIPSNWLLGATPSPTISTVSTCSTVAAPVKFGVPIRNASGTDAAGGTVEVAVPAGNGLAGGGFAEGKEYSDGSSKWPLGMTFISEVASQNTNLKGMGSEGYDTVHWG